MINSCSLQPVNTSGKLLLDTRTRLHSRSRRTGLSVFEVYCQGSDPAAGQVTVDLAPAVASGCKWRR
ncbi:MAG: hypothetical protein IBX69_12510 [Anaerolineales bacterium]|nr:hypothetical protein [Anaerolineales bacterium]